MKHPNPVSIKPAAAQGTVYVLPYSLNKVGDLSEVYQPYVLKSFSVSPSIGSLSQQDLERLRHIKGRVPFQHYDSFWHVDLPPVFVAFHDEANPRSIYQVDPDHLDAAFGPGVHFVGIDLEVTDAPLTHELLKRLPWLKLRNSIRWEREPAGSRRPMKEWPLGFKITAEHFFGNAN